MADGRHFEKKTVKSPYISNRLTDFDEIWNCDANWLPTGDRPLKFRISHISINLANLVKIGRVDVKITGLAKIVLK